MRSEGDPNYNKGGFGGEMEWNRGLEGMMI